MKYFVAHELGCKKGSNPEPLVTSWGRYDRETVPGANWVTNTYANPPHIRTYVRIYKDACNYRVTWRHPFLNQHWTAKLSEKHESSHDKIYILQPKKISFYVIRQTTIHNILINYKSIAIC